MPALQQRHNPEGANNGMRPNALLKSPAKPKGARPASHGAPNPAQSSSGGTSIGARALVALTPRPASGVQANAGMTRPEQRPNKPDPARAPRKGAGSVATPQPDAQETLAPKAKTNQPSPQAVAAGTSPEPIRIAVVDCDETARTALRTQLEGAGTGWVVTSYASAQEALEGNRESPAAAVVSELRLGDRCGIKLARRLRRATPNTRVVIHTSRADPEAVWGALSAGVRGYLTKPAPATRIVNALTLVLRGEYAFCDSAQAIVLMGIERMGEFAELRSLTPREYEVLACVCRTRKTQEATRELKISKGTLHCYRMSLLKKLHAHSLADVVERFLSFVTFGVDGSGPRWRGCLGCDQ
jgi:DNA-binding NarL/FixJ family response regulator